MATYVLINLIFIAISLVVVRRWLRPLGRATLFTFGVLIVLTLVFDNLIIAFDIVRYTPGHHLGVYLGIVPVEDFMYSLLAVILVPAIWRMFGEKNV